jgi:hypothetical protein
VDVDHGELCVTSDIASGIVRREQVPASYQAKSNPWFPQANPCGRFGDQQSVPIIAGLSNRLHAREPWKRESSEKER